ncbi:MAG: hypothetical protein OQJ91_02565 [Motiliproteus sp.]|nr:hypothetical protein [Motiliproteus sp.]
MALRALYITLLLALTTVLSGCSGHPGTGHWVANKANELGFWVLVIEFDGKAKILTKTEGTPKMGCYWKATSGDSMSLQCATKETPETPEDFELKVTGDLASFSKDGKEVAEFRRRM